MKKVFFLDSRLRGNDRCCQSGFTIIELLIVIAIILTLGIGVGAFSSRFFLQNAVSNTVDQLTGELTKAQIYAMMGKQNGNWGVHVSSNQIILFQGSSYAGRDTAFDETFTREANVSITGITDVVFSRITGTPSASPTIIISGGGDTKTMTINSLGVVSR